MLLYVPPGLIFRNSTRCSHCVYGFCTGLRTNSYFCVVQY